MALVMLGGHALVAADKDTVKVPDGLKMSEFRSYETWAVAATSETDELMKVMEANPASALPPRTIRPLPARASRQPPRSSRS